MIGELVKHNADMGMYDVCLSKFFPKINHTFNVYRPKSDVGLYIRISN